MRKITLSGLALLLAAFFGMMQFAPAAAFARSTTVTQTGHKAQQARRASHRLALNFLGTIAKQNGHYVLVAGIFSYKLNNQAMAKKYKGKKVQITGTLNPETNTIRVQKIQRTVNF